MSPVSFRANLTRALVIVLAGITAPALSAASYLGRPVRAVLQELQGAGFTLIYNDHLVPDNLRVLAEPAATSGIPLLNQILAPHGLTTQDRGSGIWAIVAAAPDRAPAADPTPMPPPLATPLEEVIVSASRYNLASEALGTHTFLTQDELRSLPKLADEPLRAVHRLPGAASNGVSGLAHIRGGDENETQIVLDELPLREPFHLKNFFSPVSVLDAEIVGGLDVYAGGFPVDYGGRMSAVVDVRSVDPAADGAYAVGLSLFHLNLLAGDTFAGGRGRWLASARRSNLSEVINVAESNLGEPRYVDAFVKGEFDLSDHTTVATHALFAEDRIQLNDSPETEFAKTLDRNFHLWATVEHRWSDELLGRALLAWTSVDNDRAGFVNDPGRRIGTVDDGRESRSALLKFELERGDDTLRWRAGVDAAWLTAAYDYSSTFQTSEGFPYPGSAPETLVRDSQLAPEGTETGAFLAARWRITDNLTGEVGLRWDNQTYDRVDGGTQLSPRVNLLYDSSSRTQFRASWGRFYQAQGINELQVEDGIEKFFPAQRADHFILSVEHAFTDTISARVEAYHKDYGELRPRFENLFDPLVILPELQTDRVRVAAESGTVRGLELLLRDRSAKPWGWWLSYTWSRALEVVDREDVPRSWDQPHSVNGGISWTRGSWDLALAGTWHSGWPTTLVSLAPAPDPDVVTGARNSARFGDFGSVDLRAGYTFQLGDTKLLTFIEVVNLLAQENPCCVEYSVVDADTAAPELRRHIDVWPRFIPNLGVLWKF